MTTYKSFQFAKWIAIFLPLMGWIFYAYYFQLGSKPLPFAVMLLLEALFIGIVLAFYGLTIIVDEKLIHIKFGIGWLNFKFKMEDIESVKVVKNKMIYGAGIKVIPNGWLYNVHGLDAVELRFKGKKKVVRIGSGEVEVLREEIEKRI